MHRSWFKLVMVVLCFSLLPNLAHAQSTPAAGSLPHTVALSNGVRITFQSVTYNADGTSVWRYQVAEATGQDLSAWLLQLPSCATVSTATPDPWSSVNPDPAANFAGVKWQPDASFTSGDFSVTMSGPVLLGSVKTAATGASLAQGTIAGPVCGATTVPITVTLSNGYRITLLSVTAHADGTSTWRYRVDELPSAQDLSNWALELENCVVVTASPEPWEVVNPDPNAQLNGVKWQTGAGFTTGEFTVKLGELPAMGAVAVAAKGPDVVRGEIAGPLCTGAGEPDAEPPAVIVITPPQTRIILEGGVSIVVVVITIDNKGGDGKGVFLTIELDDDELELIDLAYLERIGYIKEIGKGRIVIGLGQNNVMRRDHPVSVQIKFKSKGNGKGEFKTTFRYAITYNDSTGTVAGQPVEVNLVIPAIVITPVVLVPIRLSVEQIDGRFRTRWNRGGGLIVYGLPLTVPVTLRNGVVVQYFERARFEYHPELAGTPNEILLGLLGVELGYVQPPVPPPTSTLDLQWHFAPTGHTIAPQFRSFWSTRGGLLIYGYPIGEAFVDSNGRLVQYFERTRLELHEELPGRPVLLGLLGEELFIKLGGAIKVEVDD